MRRLLFCGLALSLLGLAMGCKSSGCGCNGGGGGGGLFGGHVAGVCDCGEAPVQPIMQPYGINAGPPAAAAPAEAAKEMPNAPADDKK